MYKIFEWEKGGFEKFHNLKIARIHPFFTETLHISKNSI